MDIDQRPNLCPFFLNHNWLRYNLNLFVYERTHVILQVVNGYRF